MGGEECWQEIINMVNQADSVISKQLEKMEGKDYAEDLQEKGMPTYD